MHPELLNNSLFLRYYARWQKDPDSVVFAPIADFLLRYGLIDAAQKVCVEGLKRHPALTVGRIVMARIHLARGNFEEAEEETRQALLIAPKSLQAEELLGKINEARGGSNERHVAAQVQGGSSVPSEWQTVTMAQILAGQGHNDKAKDIYRTILARDPDNEEAHRGLAAINP